MAKRSASGVGGRVRPAAALLLAGLVALPAGNATAQEAPAGLRLTLDLDQRLEADTNPGLAASSPGTGLLATTGLSFGLESRTRTQSLSLGLSSRLRLRNDSDGNDAGASIDDPRLRFSYTLDAARARLTLRGNYRKSDIAFLRPESDFLGPGGVLMLPADLADLYGSGDRLSWGMQGTLELGRDAPLGLILRGSHDVLDYSATTAPDLFDTTRTRLGGTLRMRLSPVTEGRLVFDYNTYEARDAELTDRITTLYSFGISHDLSRAMSLEVSLGYSRSETDKTIGGVRGTRTEDGITGGLELTLARPNGTASIGIDHTVNHNGERTEFTLARSIDLPAGQASASIGASTGNNGRTHLIGALDWQNELPRGILTVGLSRAITPGTDDDDELQTRLRISYTQELGPVSNLALTATHVVSDEFLAATKVQNTALGISYNHSLDRNWTMTTGYTWRRRAETGQASATGHTVFVSVGRRFSIRP